MTWASCLRRALTIICCGVLSTLASTALADNPIVQTIYTTDPAPFVHDGRVYVYTGHDEDNLVKDFFTMNEWRVYSSSDMVNWTDHGSPLSYKDFAWSKGDAWAGQVVARNGKFYYYVPTTSAALGRMAIGVGIADSPVGPFEDALGHPLITENCADIDPTVFIDDDGQAYLYWGNPNLCYVKLNQDMLSYAGSVVHVPMTTASFGTRSNNERPTTYEEGPWFYKRGALYYLVFAAGPISEHIGYSTSNSPTGPWSYRGVIMPTQGASFTNHPGVIDFLGSSYFFYHNGALPGGGGYHRSVSVEKFSYAADGSWPKVDMTPDGAPAAATLDPYVQTEAETIAAESGVETEPCSEGGMDVGSIDDGDHIEVKNVDFGSSPGAVSFEARVASAASGGNIELHLDRLTGTLIGTCKVGSTGGWQSWVTTTCPVSETSGVHDVYLKLTGAGGPLFNVNWWRFNSPEHDDAGVATDSIDGGSDGGSAAGSSGGAPAPTSATSGVSGASAGAAEMGSSAGGTSGTVVPTVGSAAGGSSSGAGSSGDDAGASPSSHRAAGCACRSGPDRDGPASAAMLLLALLAVRSLKRRH